MSDEFDEDLEVEESEASEAIADIGDDDALADEGIDYDTSAPRSSLAIRRALELRREQQRMERDLDYLSLDLDD